MRLTDALCNNEGYRAVQEDQERDGEERDAKQISRNLRARRRKAEHFEKKDPRRSSSERAEFNASELLLWSGGWGAIQQRHRLRSAPGRHKSTYALLLTKHHVSDASQPSIATCTIYQKVQYL